MYVYHAVWSKLITYSIRGKKIVNNYIIASEWSWWNVICIELRSPSSLKTFKKYIYKREKRRKYTYFWRMEKIRKRCTRYYFELVSSQVCSGSTGISDDEYVKYKSNSPSCGRQTKANTMPAANCATCILTKSCRSPLYTHIEILKCHYYYHYYYYYTNCVLRARGYSDVVRSKCVFFRDD